MTKMKMFMNKIMLLTTAVLIMIIVSGEIMYNKAANTVDTAWSFYLQTSSWNYSYTTVRQKEDYSKSYCYVQNMDSGLPEPLAQQPVSPILSEQLEDTIFLIIRKKEDMDMRVLV